MLCEPRSFVSARRRTGSFSINDRAFANRKSALIVVRAEGYRPRLRSAGSLSAAFIDRDIVRRLVLEDAQLGRAIFRRPTITIEMIGREIQPDADRRPERVNRLQLK